MLKRWEMLGHVVQLRKKMKCIIRSKEKLFLI